MNFIIAVNSLLMFVNLAVYAFIEPAPASLALGILCGFAMLLCAKGERG